MTVSDLKTNDAIQRMSREFERLNKNLETIISILTSKTN